MLSKEDKDRIREEEIYRQEIRAEIEQKKEREREKSKYGRKKLWAFLNTAFGIWLLTTFIVGLGGWSFTKWQDWHLRGCVKSLHTLLEMKEKQAGKTADSRATMLLDWRETT